MFIMFLMYKYYTSHAVCKKVVPFGIYVHNIGIYSQRVLFIYLYLLRSTVLGLITYMRDLLVAFVLKTVEPVLLNHCIVGTSFFNEHILKQLNTMFR